MQTQFFGKWLARQRKPRGAARHGHAVQSVAAVLFLAALVAVDNLTPTRQTAGLPPEGIWKILSEMTWRLPESLSDAGARPQFSPRIRALNGTSVTIGGYLIPTDLHGTAGTLILSAYPVQSCFFCGGAGPESVVEVHPAKKANYLMKKLVFRGKLVLNETDPERMVYQLENAERVFEE